MAISESQLETWAKQGSVTQSSTTYATIKNALEASDTAYAGTSYTSFLQGSYGNDTNIWADSDVDIVMRIDSIFYSDLSSLAEDDKATYNAGRSNSSYSVQDFRKDVTAQLTSKFGESVKSGKKAIFIPANGSRRDADVVVCAEYRKYTKYKSAADYNYTEGITFWTPDGTQIINYPKHHSANCTAKHKNTNFWFKPVVRIIKNMRNRMIDDNYIKEGLAPSYFIEGMLYNVPDASFGSSYGNSVVAAINWLVKAERAKLLCANEQYYLLHPTSPVTWRDESLTAFLDGMVKYWNDWGN